MANPFDQFDPAPQSGGANPFDQFDSAAAAAPKETSKDPGLFGSLGAGLKQGAKDLSGFSSAWSGKASEAPAASEEQPEAAKPMTWGDVWHPKLMAEKALYGLAQSSPQIAGAIVGGLGGGYAGGAAGTAIAGLPGTAIGTTIGGVSGAMLGAGVTSYAQALKPAFDEEAQKTPDDLDGAFQRATKRAVTEGAISGAVMGLFEVAPFTWLVKSELGKMAAGSIAPEAVAKSISSAGAKDLALQAGVIQPAAAVAGSAIQANQQGKDFTAEDAANAGLSGLVGTAVPVIAHKGIQAGMRRLGIGAEAPAAEAAPPPLPEAEKAVPDAEATKPVKPTGQPVETPNVLYGTSTGNVLDRQLTEPELAVLQKHKEAERLRAATEAGGADATALPEVLYGLGPGEVMDRPLTDVEQVARQQQRAAAQPQPDAALGQTPPDVLYAAKTGEVLDRPLTDTEQFAAEQQRNAPPAPEPVDHVRSAVNSQEGPFTNAAIRQAVKDQGVKPGQVNEALAQMVSGGEIARDKSGKYTAVKPPEAEAPPAPPSPAQEIAAPPPHDLGDPWEARAEPSDDERAAFDRGADARLSNAEPDEGTRTNPVTVTHPHDLAVAERHVDTEPTEGQKEAGNYQKGHIDIHGLDVTIENPKGSMRKGFDDQGKPWKSKLPETYGYIKRTTGADGDQVDAYVGPKPESQRAYVIDQVDPKTGAFDEHKVMLGFPDQKSAVTAYEQAFSDGSGRSRIGNVTGTSVDKFKDWLANGDTTKPFAKEKPTTFVTPRRAGRIINPDLLQAIAGRGGIRPDEGGDLKAMDAHNVFLPKLGKLVRPDGMDSDYMREFLNGINYPHMETVDDLHKAIGKSIAAMKAGRPEQRIYAGHDLSDVIERMAQSKKANDRYASVREMLLDQATDLNLNVDRINRLPEEQGNVLLRNMIADEKSYRDMIEHRNAMDQMAIEEAREVAHEHALWLDQMGDDIRKYPLYDEGTARTLSEMEKEDAERRQAEADRGADQVPEKSKTGPGTQVTADQGARRVESVGAADRGAGEPGERAPGLEGAALDTRDLKDVPIPLGDQPLTPEELKARADKAEIARRQASTRPAAQQEAPGGMFDTQKDMFGSADEDVRDNPHEIARDAVLQRGQNGKEHNYFIDKDGKTWIETSNSATRAAYTEETRRKLEDPSQGIDLHHNHPSGKPLSSIDISELWRPGLNWIAAHTADGMSAARLAPGIKEKLQSRPFGQEELMGRISQTWRIAGDELAKAEIARRLGREFDDSDQRQIVAMALHKAGLIDYISTRDPNLPKDTLDSIVDQASRPSVEFLNALGATDGNRSSRSRRLGRSVPEVLRGDEAPAKNRPVGARGDPGRQGISGAPSSSSSDEGRAPQGVGSGVDAIRAGGVWGLDRGLRALSEGDARTIGRETGDLGGQATPSTAARGQGQEAEPGKGGVDGRILADRGSPDDPNSGTVRSTHDISDISSGRGSESMGGPGGLQTSGRGAGADSVVPGPKKPPGTGDRDSAPFQRPLPGIAGKIQTYVKDKIEADHPILRSLKMFLTPMSVGTDQARGMVKDAANHMAEADRQGHQFLTDLGRKFTKDQLKTMYEANDASHIAAMQQMMAGATKAEAEAYVREKGIGMFALPADQRAIMDSLNQWSENSMNAARASGLYEGESLPFYGTRSAVTVNAEGGFGKFTGKKPEGGGASALDQIGGIQTNSANLKMRKNLTMDEYEATIKAIDPTAQLARDPRATVLALMRLDKANAGHTLVDQIKAYGGSAGERTVSDTQEPGFFRIDNPAFTEGKPRYQTIEVDPRTLANRGYQVRDGAVYNRDGEELGSYTVGRDGAVTQLVRAKDENGNTIYDRKPIWISRDFEGPLRAVMSSGQGALDPAYQGLMKLKSTTMGLIMYSPLIHGQVVAGKALSFMPGSVATLQVYRDGARIRRENPEFLKEATLNGARIMGSWGADRDIGDIMNKELTGQSQGLVTNLLGKAGDMVSQKAGENIRQMSEKVGDFWHNQLLWERVADLQVGLMKGVYDGAIKDGLDHTQAMAVAAHIGNRVAGSLPMESMGQTARKLANAIMFSRSFTVGNLGIFKDALKGLPSDTRSALTRAMGEAKADQASNYLRSKARKALVVDIALTYGANSLLQDAFHVMGVAAGTAGTLGGFAGAVIGRRVAGPMGGLVGAGAGMALGALGFENTGSQTLEQAADGYATRAAEAFKGLDDHWYNILDPTYFARHISSTYWNEPGRQNRVQFGHDSSGTAQYVRLPVGKFGEELVGWPANPLEMMRKKLSPLAGAGLDVVSNSDSFGKPIYDKDAQDLQGWAKNAGRIVEHIMTSQGPMQEIRDVSALIQSDKDSDLAAMRAAAPLAGFTFSRGYPGGEAKGIMAEQTRRLEMRTKEVMPGVRRAVEQGRIADARQMMLDEGYTPKQAQQAMIRYSHEGRMQTAQMRRFNREATPVERAQMDRAQGSRVD